MSFTAAFHLTLFHRPRTGPRLGSPPLRLRQAVADAPLTSPGLHCLPSRPGPRPVLRRHWGIAVGPDGRRRLEARWREEPFSSGAGGVE